MLRTFTDEEKERIIYEAFFTDEGRLHIITDIIPDPSPEFIEKQVLHLSEKGSSLIKTYLSVNLVDFLVYPDTNFVRF